MQDKVSRSHQKEKELGKKIELIVTTDYSSMIEAMRFGVRLDPADRGLAVVDLGGPVRLVHALVADDAAQQALLVLGVEDLELFRFVETAEEAIAAIETAVAAPLGLTTSGAADGIATTVATTRAGKSRMS